MMGGMGGMMGGTGGDMGDDLDDSDNEVETVEMAELSQILVAPDVSGCAQFRPLEFYSTISDLQIWGPPNLDSLVNAMKIFVPHVVMKNKNIIPQSGSALVPSLHAEELRADGKFKAVRGKLTLGKAEACGIKDKRRLGQLQKGFSVKSDFLDIEVHPNDLRAGLSLLTVVCQVQGSNQPFSEAGVGLPRLSLPDTHGVGMNRVDPFSGPSK
ncbi:hypothetical protein T459_13897 [Capsicum annuum]|uniref:Uncharacterized protein n=1 Tax=Capsicum annuum TaxID=4072 RepID=A0A2G2ZFV4_CAPAN|nr:hypothetical protein T459_13897 [Capsicum annuum]